MKRALIIGFGKSGKAAAAFLLKQGYEIAAYDDKEGIEFGDIQRYEKGSDFDIAILSPGIHPEHPLCLEARRKNIEVIGEVELGARFFKGMCIGVTGTNGKSTIVSLIAHALNRAGIPAKAAGNIGIPFTELLNEKIIILEVSSFQLETLKTPLFDAAAILNITPDHLDRYKTMQDYILAKMGIVKVVKKGGKVYMPSHVHEGYPFPKNPHIRQAFPSGYTGFSLELLDLSFALCGISAKHFIEAVKTFQKLSHRLEYVETINGILYINDSKATNVDSTSYALQNTAAPIILIAGGRYKGGSFKSWNPLLKEKGKCVFVYGEAKNMIKAELADTAEVIEVQTLKEAVGKAAKIAQRGDTVLLSPGCSSFDMFKDFVDRGDKFKQYVRGML